MDYGPSGHNGLSCGTYKITKGFPGGSDGKESAWNAGDPVSIPGLGKSPGEGNGYPLQYSCLENSKDRRAWPATVSPWGHRVGHNWTINTFTLFTYSLDGRPQQAALMSEIQHPRLSLTPDLDSRKLVAEGYVWMWYRIWDETELSLAQGSLVW